MVQRNDNIKWTSETTYVDVMTGEQIPRHIFENEYTKVKTHKIIYIDDEQRNGHIQYTTTGVKSKYRQLELFRDNP